MPWTAWADVLRRSPRWDEVVFWALDLETSGLRTREDRILSVGMVPVRSGTVRYGERFYSLVRPPEMEDLSDEGLRAHHILPVELDGAPVIQAVLPEVDRRLQEGVLVLHHAPLDLGFLREAYRRTAIPWPRPRVVDTVRLVADWHRRVTRFHPHPPPPPLGLPTARKSLGLPTHRHHHALDDALATAELFLALRARLEARTLRQLTGPRLI